MNEPIQSKENLASTIATAVLAQGYNKDTLIEVAVLIAAVETACAGKSIDALTENVREVYNRAQEEQETMDYLRKLDQSKLHPNPSKTKH